MLPHAPITTTNHKAHTMNTTANNIKGSAATTFIGGLLVLLISLFLLVKLATTGYYSNVADMQPSAVDFCYLSYY